MLSELIQGSAHSLPSIPDKSIHMIVTSPPYYSLRKYAGDQCVDWPPVTYAPMTGIDCTVTIPAMSCDLGQEPTLEAYIGHLILCLREWHRVLRDDGTCWINLGDSYSGSGGGGGDYANGFRFGGQPKPTAIKSPGLKAKDLCMVPQRFALAAQADGWWVRAEVIWAKKSPMPESATDRPTRAHEQIYLLAKAERYYYDHVAVRTAAKESTVSRNKYDYNVAFKGQFVGSPTDKRNKNGKQLSNASFGEGGANLRDVWTLSSTPFKGSHFATFPEHIPGTAIKAGTSARGCCPACGAGWGRVIEKTFVLQGDVSAGKNIKASNKGMAAENGWGDTPRGTNCVETTGWAPGCSCDAGDPIPCTVADFFSGSGTTGMVANRLGRRYIGVDISAEYLEELTPARLSNVQMEMTF